MKLLGRADSLNVRKVLWALAEMEISIEREDFGGPFGKVDTTDYLSKNPNGLVPTLIDGDTTIWESNTIIRYLAERHAKSHFGGRDAIGRARISQWMDWQLSALSAPFQTLFTQLGRLPEDKRDKNVLEATLHSISGLFTVLGRALPEQGNLFGANVTAADVAIGVMLHRYFSLVPEPTVEARIVRYHCDLAARPGFQSAVAIGKP